MSRRPKLSTSTLTADGQIVPWLAAAGPLSYTPEDPPSSDYYFQYGWVLPEVLNPTINRRRHFYFGAARHNDPDDLMSLWHAARATAPVRVLCRFGAVGTEAVTAPLAVYSATLLGGEAGYVLMQHGSYQMIKAEEQPLLHAGEVVLYRGVEKSDVFRFPRVGLDTRGAEDRETWRSYVKTQAQVLSDSAVSFNSIHDRTKRCETSHIRDGTWLTDKIARKNGLDIDAEGFAKELWSTTHQSFALARRIAEYKFGPHYVKCKTAATNIRMTTFFAGEHEVRIIDPDRVEFLDTVGCRVERG